MHAEGGSDGLHQLVVVRLAGEARLAVLGAEAESEAVPEHAGRRHVERVVEHLLLAVPAHRGGRHPCGGEGEGSFKERVSRPVLR